MKKGFTLAEMLITTGLISVLACILLPMLGHIQPNEEMLKFKKAYYLTERAVSELINDDDIYPEPEDNQLPFLGNTVQPISPEYGDPKYSGLTKFCELFASKLNTISDVTCQEHQFADGQAPVGTFTTSDQVVWILPVTTFDNNNTEYNIQLDVNGTKAPNCVYNQDACAKPDRFTIHIFQDGRVSVDGVMEREYLTRSRISDD